MFNRFIRFIQVDIWRIRLEDLPRKKMLLFKPLMVMVLALRGMTEDNLHLKAAALTFLSLLSIVPLMAVAFGIAKGFGLENLLEGLLRQHMAGQEEVLDRIIMFSRRMLDDTRGGLIAGIGVAALFGVVVRMLTFMERSFNDIWGVKEIRPPARRFSDYIAVILIAPLLFIISSSATVFISTRLSLLAEQFLPLETARFLLPLFRLIPYLVVWILFTFLYIFIPNTQVKAGAAVLGGLVAGTIYQLVQLVYVGFQIGVARYNAIYGSFAALPLFLVWLQMSWLIMLFGAELSFAWQNVRTYEYEPDCLNIKYSLKRLLTLQIMVTLVKNFQKAGKPLSENQLYDKLGLPIRLVRQILFELEQVGLILRSEEKTGQDSGYQIARSPEDLTIKSVISCLEENGSGEIPYRENEDLKKIASSLKRFEETVSSLPENQLLTRV